MPGACPRLIWKPSVRSLADKKDPRGCSRESPKRKILAPIMTPLQFPKKPDFSSPEWQRKKLEEKASRLIWKIVRLQDQRDQIDEQIELLEKEHSEVEQQLKTAGAEQ